MKLQPHDLTFRAEALGKRHPPPRSWLTILAGHASSVVREGAVYGKELCGTRARLQARSAP